LYDLKIMIFLEEVLNVLTTPFVLRFSLPNCRDKIVDFFWELTVYVDGIGYVCSFAVFDFERPGKVTLPSTTPIVNEFPLPFFSVEPGI
jgi:autophagy-related protein 9